ncbi:MAG: DNA polymerase III subunit gamma/tau [Eubacteriales bacterium]|nr:DNA polymerase III subunit gamma/tau [Eubacteriales bacterium]
MYTALYRSFRPETFDGILGQEHIVKILKNQLKNGTTVHAYLFCGTRGTGKTSTARILAKGMNCLADKESRPCGVCANCISIRGGIFIDVIEIDAASHNGVDNIRELRESVKYPPAAGRCKVYIIDEVHMLSAGAFNALLKTLEEPPENIMFILATTESQKLPATILSRCLRLDFKRIPEKTMLQGMRDICGRLGVNISGAALGLIASNADGSVRDALSLLDQCISSGEKSVTRENVIEILGTAGEEVFIEMTGFMVRHQVTDALLLLDRIISDGKDERQFIKDWIVHFRNLMMTKFIRNPEDILNMSIENIERIRKQSEETDLSFINDSIIKLSQTLSEAKWSTQPRILLELCIVKLATADQTVTDQNIYQSPRETASQNNSKRGDIGCNSKTLQQTEADSFNKTKANSERPLAASENKKEASVDYDKLWYTVFEEGESLKGSFNLLRVGTVLKEINDNNFTVEASNETIMYYVKENASDLEALMEKHLGKKLRLECCVANDDDQQEKKKTAEELADEIGNKFGIQIDVL